MGRKKCLAPILIGVFGLAMLFVAVLAWRGWFPDPEYKVVAAGCYGGSILLAAAAILKALDRALRPF